MAVKIVTTGYSAYTGTDCNFLANVTDMGGHGALYVYFEYSRFVEGYNQQSFWTVAFGTGPISVYVSGLEKNVIYFFRAVAFFGEDFGYGQKFTLYGSLFVNELLSSHGDNIQLTIKSTQHTLDLTSAQVPMPGAVSLGNLQLFSYLFSLGICNETIKINGIVQTEAERLALEKAVRSWYYWETPATGILLTKFYDDDGVTYRGLLGPISWIREGGKGLLTEYTLTFYVIQTVR
jgi:hypothetical protein